MVQNKIVAIGILLSIGLAILTAFMLPANEDAWYEIAGLGMVIFGIWGAILLLKK